MSRAWQREAACSPADAHLFAAEDPRNTVAAKQICARCSVVEQCRDFAVDEEMTTGVWGGLSPGERKAYRWVRPRRYEMAS